jgi:hypothetical protein
MATQWFFAKDGSKGKMHGPVSGRELKRLAATGGLAPTDRVKKDGMEKSVSARRVKGLFAPPAETN